MALRFREGPNSLGIRLVLDARFLQSPANLHGKTYLLKRWAGPLCTNAQAVTAWLAVRILLLLLLLFRGFNWGIKVVSSCLVAVIVTLVACILVFPIQTLERHAELTWSKLYPFPISSQRCILCYRHVAPRFKVTCPHM